MTGAPLSACAVLGLLYALVCIQLLPSPAQGYYWWNGASYYWLFFFGLLTLGALLARLLGPGLSGPGTLGAAPGGHSGRHREKHAPRSGALPASRRPP